MRFYIQHSIPVLQQALVLWLLLALVLPWLISRRRGTRISLSDLGFTALLTLYIAGVLAYTFLPLPAPGELVCGPGTNYPRWFLGWSISLALRGGGGLLGLLSSVQVLQLLLNVLLFIPFGFIARARWRLRLTPLFYAAWGTSFLIELTQLTGFWGLYPCPVRTFDAEDILTNILGAVLGWTMVALWQHRRELRLWLGYLRR